MSFIKRAVVPIIIEDEEEVADWGKVNEVGQNEDIDLITHRRLAMAKLATKQAQVFKSTNGKAVVSKPIAPKADPTSEK